MYRGYFVNEATGELKQVSEPWRDAPAIWRQIMELVRRGRADRSVTTYSAWVAEKLCRPN